MVDDDKVGRNKPAINVITPSHVIWYGRRDWTSSICSRTHVPINRFIHLPFSYSHQTWTVYSWCRRGACYDFWVLHDRHSSRFLHQAGQWRRKKLVDKYVLNENLGRGPVIGPLVYGVAFCPASWKSDLDNLGFAGEEHLPLTINNHSDLIIRF